MFKGVVGEELVKDFFEVMFVLNEELMGIFVKEIGLVFMMFSVNE